MKGLRVVVIGLAFGILLDGASFAAESPAAAAGNDGYFPMSVMKAQNLPFEPCAGSYTVTQFNEVVVLSATVIHPTSGYQTFFQQSHITVSPPEFGLWHTKPSGSVLPDLTPDNPHTWFTSKEPVRAVRVHDADGVHEVSVVQFSGASKHK